MNKYILAKAINAKCFSRLLLVYLHSIPVPPPELIPLIRPFLGNTLVVLKLYCA